MTENNFTISITVGKSAAEVFQAICDVREWWSGQYTGDADSLGAEFVYQYKDMHKTTQKVTEFVPGKRIVWHVTDADLSFTKNKKEWLDTDIIFDISENNGETTVNFTHVGLTPECECYGVCSNGWTMLITTNLKNYILNGKVQPDVFAKSE